MLSIEAKKIIESEWDICAIRSSGSGGQNVNKVSTKIQLTWNMNESQALNDVQKEILAKKLKSKMDTLGNIQVDSQESRSQANNKKHAIKKLFDLINEGLRIPKKRVPTTKTVESIKKRLTQKKILSEKKSLRKFRPD